MRKNGMLRIIKFTVAGIAGLCVIIIIVLFMISGFFMHQKYMEPWKKITLSSSQIPG